MFREQLDFLQKSEFWQKEQMERHQSAQLQKLIRHVYDNVPYYRREFKKLGLEPGDFTSLNDITKLPFLTKETIQANYDDFIPDGVDKNSLYHRSTGGSTGTPLVVYMDMNHLGKDKANTEYYMKVAGYNIFDYRSVRLYGDMIPEAILNRGEYWYFEEDRKMVMSCYHITNTTTPLYIRQINQFQPEYIHSRPSAIYPLCRQLQDLGLKLSFNLKAVFLDGECLPESQRALIEQVLDCRVYLVYGHTEGCVAGISCSQSRYLHFMPQVGLLELLRPDGSYVTQDGEDGEMVVTGFNNYMFPLIRYRTLDIGTKSNAECPCNRNYNLLERVDGRMQDYAINRAGDSIPVAPAIFNYNDLDWTGVHQFQVIQEKQGELQFKVVLEQGTAKPSDVLRNELFLGFNAIFGGMFDFKFDYVDDLPRTRLGKFRYFEQKLDVSGHQFSATSLEEN